MATITASCPSCGQKLPPPGPDGAVVCPNPACGQPVAVQPVLAAALAPPRANGSRPELLDQLPIIPYLSPPVFAIGGVAAFLYGLVLFAVVSAHRRALPPPPEHEPDLLTLVPVRPLASEPPKVEAKTSDAKKTDAKKSEKKKPKSAAKSSEAASKGSSNKGETASKEGGEKKKAPPKKKTPKKKTPSKTELAKATPPPPPPPPKTVTWGALSGLDGDCQFATDGTSLTITIPGTLHVISHELKTVNAPGLLAPVRGDFTASVQVPGKRLLPGTVPLPKLLFTFQGAGLIVWQDPNNYLVLERTAYYDTVDRKRLHRILLEGYRDGKPVKPAYRDARDADITVKLERHGSEVWAYYTPDEKNWIEVKRQPVSFANEVHVGITASNASPKPFEARFDRFQLATGAGASGKDRGGGD